MAAYPQVSYQVGECRACGVLDLCRSTHRYLSVAAAGNGSEANVGVVGGDLVGGEP